MSVKKATSASPKWLNASEMKAWRGYIVASRRLLEALDFDLSNHELSMADYEVLAQLSEAPGRRMAYERVGQSGNDFALAFISSNESDGKGRVGYARILSRPTTWLFRSYDSKGLEGNRCCSSQIMSRVYEIDSSINLSKATKLRSLQYLKKLESL
ncbi:MAG: hypothetical protein WDO06_03665 [Actinomycetota bacterium]